MASRFHIQLVYLECWTRTVFQTISDVINFTLGLPLKTTVTVSAGKIYIFSNECDGRLMASDILHSEAPIVKRFWWLSESCPLDGAVVQRLNISNMHPPQMTHNSTSETIWILENTVETLFSVFYQWKL